MHRCEEWTRSGINCPGGLLDKKKGQKKIPEEDVPEGVELQGFPGHKKAREQISQFQQAELAMLLELHRQAVVARGRALGAEPVRVPVEMFREAWGQGARGKELALWVAAGAATLAVGLYLGPGAAARIPGLLRPAGGGYPSLPMRGGRGGKGGGMGYNFAAPTYGGNVIKVRPKLNWRKEVERFLGGYQGGSGSGEFFPGILG